MNSNTKIKNIIFIVIAALIFIVAFIFVYDGYRKEGEKRSVFVETASTKQDYINISAYIVSIDPIKGEMPVRLSFEPNGTLVNESGYLNEEVNLYINSASGKQEYEFARNKIMNPVDIILNLYDGFVTDYPLDRHKAELIIAATEKRIIDENQKETEEISLDNVLNFYGSVPGYDIKAVEDPDSDNTYTILNINIERSGSVIFFSIFVIIVMWILILLLMALIYTILVKGRKIEIAMFTFASAMIFAFPAFRNMMPHAPPIGAFPDYIAFFWAETAAALTLVVLIVTWIARKQT